MTDSALGDLAARLAPHEGQSYEEIHDVLAAARFEQPVFYWEPLKVWMVTRHDDVLEVLRKPEIFSNVGVLGSVPHRPENEALLVEHRVPDHVDTQWLGIIDGERHDKMRATLQKTFTPRRIVDLEPTIQQLADDLLDQWDPQQPVEFVSQFAYPFPIGVILAMIGLPGEPHPHLRRWSDDLVRFMTTPMSEDDEAAATLSIIELNDWVGELLAERRKRPGDDFLSALVTAAATDPETRELWGDDELRHFVSHGLILAGHETTKAVMAAGLWRLLGENGGLRRLAESPDLVPKAVEEALRHDPPLIGMFRTVTEDTTIGTVAIPVGSRVCWSISSANADEDRYSCPRDFVLGREPREQFHLTFGNAAHYCIGAPLARMEMTVAYSTLARRWPHARLDGRTPTYSPNALLLHLSELWIDVSSDAG